MKKQSSLVPHIWRENWIYSYAEQDVLYPYCKSHDTLPKCRNTEYRGQRNSLYMETYFRHSISSRILDLLNGFNAIHCYLQQKYFNALCTMRVLTESHFFFERAPNLWHVTRTFIVIASNFLKFLDGQSV